MNVSKLETGMVIKNYKELCMVLDLKPSTGNSKNAQYKELERFVKYHKQGNKFIIDEIYSEPLEKQDGRKDVSEDDPRRDGVNSLYRDDIAELILNLLAQSEDGQLFLSTGKLLGLLKMVNVNYTHGRNNIPKLSEILGIEEDHVYLFYNTTQTKLKSNLESALNYLRRKSKIMWETVTTVCERKAVVELNELGNPRVTDNGRIQYRIDKVYRPATYEECQIILKAEEEATDELGCNDLKQVFISGQWNSFRSIVNKKVKYLANIQYFYDSYRIIYNHDSIIKELNERDLRYKEGLLNTKIVNGLSNSGEKSHIKAKEKVEVELTKSFLDWGDFEEKSLPQTTYVKSRDNYIDNNNKLIRSVIHINSTNIVNQLYEELLPKEAVKTSVDENIPF